MRLLSLKLENFQGQRALQMDFDGRSATVYGDNATGKTTVFNALTWLLFDKPSTGAKNFSPKTRGPEGEIHGLDHAAEGRFSLADGRIVTFRKVFKELWKKKRGAVNAEFSGNTVDYYLDGVPVKEQEYTAALEGYCGGAERMMLLTMPSYFAQELPWERRRAILLEVCGDVSDEDVMDATPDLGELPGRLAIPGTAGQRYSVAEYKKILTARRTDINRQLQEIPGRVDEAARAMPDLAGLEEGALLAEKKRLFEAKTQLERERAQVLAGGAESAASKALATAQEELAKARAAYAERMSAMAAARQTVEQTLLDQISNARRDHEAAKELLRQAELKKGRLRGQREELLAEYRRVQEQQWDEAEERCPTCQRPLPPEQVARMREEFHLKKSRRLEEINTQGQNEASKDMIEAAEGDLQRCLEASATAKATLERLEAKMAERGQNDYRAENFESTEEYRRLAGRVDACQADMAAGLTDIRRLEEPYEAQMMGLDEQLEAVRGKQAMMEAAKAQRARIDELKGQEEQLAGEFESVELGIYLCELFVKTKVSMLTERINGKFRSVRFRLFQEQLNGGVKEDCEVMIPVGDGSLIPYAVANNAARVGAGLEIIKVLGAHWGMDMPVCVDNAEGVTRLPDMETQVIRLVVSAQDPVLRLELERGDTGLEGVG